MLHQIGKTIINLDQITRINTDCNGPNGPCIELWFADRQMIELTGDDAEQFRSRMAVSDMKPGDTFAVARLVPKPGA